MKEIRILFQDGTEKIYKDNNNEDFNIYCDKISQAIASSRVIILKINNKCLIYKPSKVLAIEVENNDLDKQTIIDNTSNVDIFISDNLQDEIDQDRKVKFSVVYDAYVTYCKNKEFVYLSKSKFKSNLLSLKYNVKNCTKTSNQIFVFGVSPISGSILDNFINKEKEDL